MGSRVVRLFIVALIAVGILIPTVLVLTQQKASAASMVLSVIDGTADVARAPADFARQATVMCFSPATACERRTRGMRS